MNTIYKAFSVVTKAVDLDAGIFEAMITTEAVDRAGDIVRATGARVDNYLKNPVVLWAHDYSQPPVAKALSIEVIPGSGLKAVFQFPGWGVSEQADTVRRLWAAGYLNATSIGFVPITAKALDENDRYGFGPQEFVEWELLEFSIVPVPANQDALRLAMKALVTPIEKRGRVLSAGNEKKIREATDLLQSVLDQLQREDERNAEEENAASDDQAGKAESTVDDDTEQRNEALTESLSNFISALKEHYDGTKD